MCVSVYTFRKIIVGYPNRIIVVSIKSPLNFTKSIKTHEIVIVYVIKTFAANNKNSGGGYLPW